MKYETADELIVQHIKDIVDTAPTAQAAIRLAQTVTLSILMTAHAGDTEAVLEDLDALHKHAVAGIDSGEIRCEAVQ